MRGGGKEVAEMRGGLSQVSSGSQLFILELRDAEGGNCLENGNSQNNRLPPGGLSI